MAKTVAQMIALYKEPENRGAFEKQYFEEHVPLVEKLPGLRSVEIHKPVKNLMGGESPFYMMATLTFDNMDALKAAMASPEGKATGANIMSFAAPILTLLSSEVTVTEGAALSSR